MDKVYLTEEAFYANLPLQTLTAEGVARATLAAIENKTLAAYHAAQGVPVALCLYRYQTLSDMNTIDGSGNFCCAVGAALEDSTIDNLLEHDSSMVNSRIEEIITRGYLAASEDDEIIISLIQRLHDGILEQDQCRYCDAPAYAKRAGIELNIDLSMPCTLDNLIKLCNHIIDHGV